MTLRSGKADGGVIAHDMRADHGQRLGLGRVHLARHDRRPRLVFRQDQLPQARARAGAQKPQVIGDLEEARRHGFQSAREHDHCVMGRESFEFIRGGHERQAGQLRDLARNAAVPAHTGVQPGANGGAALCQLINIRQARFHPRDALFDLLGIAAELLTQRQRRCVLRMGAADLDDILEFFGFRDERGMQLFQPRQQRVTGHHPDGDMHRGREGIVGGLAHVAVVIRVHGLFRPHYAAQHFDRAIRDHLIRVHVGLRAGPGLPDDQREVIVKLAVDHFSCGGGNRVADLGAHVPLVDIDQGTGFLDDAKRADDRNGLAFPANREILDRPLCLRAPIFVGGNIQRAKAVGFNADCGHHSLLRLAGLS